LEAIFVRVAITFSGASRREIQARAQESAQIADSGPDAPKLKG
jgi:hypothetical protein